MRVALRASLLLLIFLTVGFLAARLVVAHAATSTPAAQVHLAAAMAALFSGGAAAVLAGIAMLLVNRRD